MRDFDGTGNCKIVSEKAEVRVINRRNKIDRRMDGADGRKA